MTLLADRFLLRRTPTRDPIRRVQSVVTRTPARPVGSNIGTANRCCAVEWCRLPHGDTADQALRRAKVERRPTPKMCNLAEAGREAGKRLWRERDSAMKTGGCSGRERALLPPLARRITQICARGRRVLRAARARVGEVKRITPNSQSSRSIRRLHIEHETANLAHYLNLVTNDISCW